MTKGLELVGLGNALVDALVQIPDNGLLTEHGLERGTMHLVDEERWERVFRQLPPEDIVVRPGGSCANAVETFALLGGQASFCGQVGDDPMGALYKEKLQARLGRHHLHFLEDGSTGKCLSLVSRSDAERTMLTCLGSACELQSKNLFEEEIRRAEFLHLTGYVFTGGAIGDTARRALDVAAEAGTRVSFDLADAFVVDSLRDTVLEIARERAHILFLNEAEARSVAEGGDPLDALRSLGGEERAIVLKLGARGSLIYADQSCYPVEAEGVEAVDTTGAGDAYAGGFLYGLSRGLDWSRCGRLGSRVAARVVGQLGSVVEDSGGLV
jgi:sugar/nucleoside kinase (ribokinase family)